MRAAGRRSASCSTSVRGSGSPARLIVRKVDRGAGRPPSCTSSAMAEGTVLISVTRCFAGIADVADNAKALSTRMAVPPPVSGTKSSKTERSKQMEVEARTPARSAAGNERCAQATIATALRCSIATPLGRPVEPDVYMM